MGQAAQSLFPHRTQHTVNVKNNWHSIELKRKYKHKLLDGQPPLVDDIGKNWIDWRINWRKLKPDPLSYDAADRLEN